MKSCLQSEGIHAATARQGSSMRTYTAHDIARYFLAKTDASVGDLISNLKLQKLCYYAQGIGTVARGQPFFEEPIEAWLHGPVVPQLYRAYSNFKAEALPAPDDFDFEFYDPADRIILDDIYDYYGQYSAWRLRQMTHDEAPWKDAYVDGKNHTITIDSLINYFSNQVEDDYRRKYVEEVHRGSA